MKIVQFLLDYIEYIIGIIILKININNCLSIYKYEFFLYLLIFKFIK